MRLFALAVLLAGCATSSPVADPVDLDGTEALLGYLADQGFLVEPAGLTTSTIPLVTAATYRVIGDASPAVLEVFEFDTEAEAAGGLTRLRAEIRPRVGQEVFARGVLVVYARAATSRTTRNARLRRALADALGPPRGGA
ncbi:hypothetical protein [Rubrivirga sp. IMCC45206]|uniref:hypothetical protein n=1 Tax=Rubrivirga sp. IMCC45206 TaxID=3391614 RepID=UPI00398FF35F